jgi:hypothetical protein
MLVFMQGPIYAQKKEDENHDVEEVRGFQGAKLGQDNVLVTVKAFLPVTVQPMAAGEQKIQIALLLARFGVFRCVGWLRRCFD